MQHSPYEIKEKLLQALDHEYNVVDMAAVLDVISTLEKAIVTKEALERTRIGKYINELRKRTDNEQLARRAKDLVKSWRKLLPQTAQRVNGEDIINNIGSSLNVVPVLGPGPGPGFGPGPGPGNKALKTCASVPGTPRYKTSSPSVMGERSSSPYFSSASNSPLYCPLFQGSNVPSMPSNYAPVKFTSYHLSARGDKANSVNKGVLSVSNQSKNITISQIFKPVSPSCANIKQASNIVPNETGVLPSLRTCSPNISPVRTNSNSSSPSVVVSVNSCSVSPTFVYSNTHPTLNIAKTNAANKKLRKEDLSNCVMPKENVSDSKTKIGNGMRDLAENILPSENSAFKSVNLFNSKPVDGDKALLVTSLKTPKRKRSFEKNELHENRLGDMIASLPSGSKLPKVKTTQQLIADLQAKKILNTDFSPNNLTSVDTLHSSEAEVSRTKSELLKKFLIASQSVRHESSRESPTDESSFSVTSDYGLHSVPDVSSVINTNLDTMCSISYSNPVEEEINRILAALPPINPAEINLEDDAPSTKRPTSVTSDLNMLSEPWEYVNGVYDCHGKWRPWLECVEQKSELGESFLILPYVNID